MKTNPPPSKGVNQQPPLSEADLQLIHSAALARSRAICHDSHSDLPDEIANTVALRATHANEPIRDLARWASSAAGQETLKELSRRDRFVPLADAASAESESESPDPNSNFPQPWEIHHLRQAFPELRNLFHSLIQDLPRVEQTIFVGIYRQNLTLEEVANQTGKTAHAVSRQFYRTHIEIRNRLVNRVRESKLLSELFLAMLEDRRSFDAFLAVDSHPERFNLLLAKAGH